MRPDNHYWIHFRDVWMIVPENAVRRNFGDPTGSGVAWFTVYEGVLIINCLVPTVEY